MPRELFGHYSFLIKKKKNSHVCHCVFPFLLLNKVISFHKTLYTRYVVGDLFNLVIINLLKSEILAWIHEHHDVGRHNRHLKYGPVIMHGMVTACGI